VRYDAQHGVRRVLERRAAGQRPGRRWAQQLGLADGFTDLIFGKVKSTDGRITAKRLLPLVRAAGYAGSARTLRWAVAEQKVWWRQRRCIGGGYRSRAGSAHRLRHGHARPEQGVEDLHCGDGVVAVAVRAGHP
jgi:hypothetical protein